MQVEVYLNRRAMGKSKDRIYSLRDAKTQKVKYLNSDVLLKNVELVVQEAGRIDTLRRIETGAKVTKSVHAFLRGTLVYRGANAKKLSKEKQITQGKVVGYDPTKTESWVVLDGHHIPDDTNTCQPVFDCEYAFLDKSAIYIQ